MKTDLESNAATGDTVAAESDAPGGAREQLHSNPNPVARQDPRARAGRLQHWAEAAKLRGDYATFWRLRRQFLLLQAALYSEVVQ